MDTNQQKKPVVDAVNDTIGALSDLLRSLRAHARESAAAAKATARDVKKSAVKAGRGAVKSGKRTVGKIEAAGDGLLDKAAKVWHDITGSDDEVSDGGAPVTKTKRNSAKARK